MKRKQFSEKQIIGIPKEAEADGPRDVCATYDAWTAEFGGLEGADAKRLRARISRRRWGRASGGRVLSSGRIVRACGIARDGRMIATFGRVCASWRSSANGSAIGDCAFCFGGIAINR